MDIIANRWFLYSTACVTILFIVIAIKLLIKKNILIVEEGRKLLHFIAILTCTYVVYATEARLELAYIFIGFTIILFFVAHQNILIPNDHKSYGIALFPLSFSLLLFSNLPIDAVIFSMLTLGISDALAGYIGQKYAKNKIVFLYEAKSWLGFKVFGFCTIIIGYIYFEFNLALILLAVVIALSELFSFRGSDNFTVPVVAGFWFEIIRNKQISNQEYLIILPLFIMFYITHKRKWLTVSGTAAAILVAILIIFGADKIALIPMALFFIIGSLTSKIHSKNNGANGRNAFQVFANGLVACMCIIFFAYTKKEIFMIAYLASINISLTDTVSSDLGTYFKQKTYDILSFKPMQIGLSGGISFAGTMAGLFANSLFTLITYFIYDYSLKVAIIISVCGFLGMILDSILGSWLQIKYLDKDTIDEEATEDKVKYKGLTWMDNNMVNLLSNVIIILLLILVLKI